MRAGQFSVGRVLPADGDENAALAFPWQVWKFLHEKRDGGDPTLPASFGELLRQRRIAASLTQEKLAEMCRLSPKTVAALEQGRRRAPRLSTVKEIAEALGLSQAGRTELAIAAAAGSAAVRRSSGSGGGTHLNPVRTRRPCGSIRASVRAVSRLVWVALPSVI